MLDSMLLPHPGEMLIQAVFSGDLSRLRPVVNFLELAKSLIGLRLDVGARPHDRPLLLSIIDLSKAIVLKRISNEPDLNTIVKLEVQVFILGLIGADAHRVYVRTEHHVLL